ncbi:Uncharacterised protein [Mycobacterium tuberculosis]|uniref:Uncharacterized protein n=1 Tax=Mycobacterium tuberculosis TaxID=1773 RepID=A0A654U1N3_MYCTX|nr:Uncharacterised protein [Mycobacterium tuberculosis]CKP03479.1 Uncharacterised protein [Mycobacterium tuberculosis]CKT52279.1 Uncharacterised protein [Mycobacterium tuberculosis]CKT71141.1 Uncharacterised protein [Mycobacterium tuberculosis]CKU59297.1 Uncharacterised protein [Mycobacterium tuberculosis]
MVTLVVEGQVHAARDAAGQVLQPFEQVGFSLDVRGGGYQLLGFCDRLAQRVGVHDFDTRTCSCFASMANICPRHLRQLKTKPARFQSPAHELPIIDLAYCCVIRQSEQYIVRYMCIRSGVD